MSSKFVARIALGGVLATLLVSVSAQTLPGVTHSLRQFYPDDPLWRDDDMRTMAPPAEHDLSKSYEFVANTFGETARSFGPALNVNTLGEVPDSSWFTNRIGRYGMTVDDVLRGPNQVDGPAPGPWLITGRPDSGITPKFTIRDARGDIYLIKLDPASNPELPSSVELISTKLFHAIGYHVPQDFVVHFSPDQLVVAPGARIRNAVGERVPIQQTDIHRWLRDVPRRTDGSIRALASLWVPGKVVGQFTFNGRRQDDANDAFPHERRRELRGLRVFAAWLNHDDARAINSIDTYVEENGRGYIRHYLQDFGSNLGSGSTSAQQPRGGYEYLIERGEIGKGLIGFGLYRRKWMSITWSRDTSIGNIEADVFDPATWKTEYPNPAFKQMDAADAFWAASILSRFTDLMIRGVVEEARLTNPEAARYLADVIITRRDKTVRWGITGTNPVDRFEIRHNAAPELTYDNAAERLHLVEPIAQYIVQWASFDNGTGTTQSIRDEVETEDTRALIPPDIWGPPDRAGLRYAIALISTRHPMFTHWASPVVVTVRNRDGVVDVVGIDRSADTPPKHGRLDVESHLKRQPSRSSDVATPRENDGDAGATAANPGNSARSRRE
jgi:hypothetical protein